MISGRGGLGAVVGLTLMATLAQPAAALPLPVNRDPGVAPVVEEVQYRRRGPVRYYGRRGGGNAAAAAAVIGALAIGAAAVAASQPRQPAYYDYGYAPPAPAPVYGYRPYRYSTPPSYGYYAPPQPYGYVAPRRLRNQPAIDGGSPYAIEQQRAQNRAARRTYRPAPRVYYDDHYGP